MDGFGNQGSSLLLLLGSPPMLQLHLLFNKQVKQKLERNAPI